jgi:branched-chain amino acid transport system substrate-binding protein
MLPGVAISTRPGDYTPFRALRIATFDGESWSLTGAPLSAD